jgi:hypothetical protein
MFDWVTMEHLVRSAAHLEENLTPAQRARLALRATMDAERPSASSARQRIAAALIRLAAAIDGGASPALAGQRQS